MPAVWTVSATGLHAGLWAAAQIAVVDLKSHKVIARWPTEEHPNEMLLTDSHRVLYVANANRNTVTVFDTKTGKALETLTASLYPNWPSGSTPNSLALTPDERTLFVANADNNNLAVFDVSQPGHSHSLGFIPVGWYPHLRPRDTGNGTPPVGQQRQGHHFHGESQRPATWPQESRGDAAPVYRRTFARDVECDRSTGKR